MRFGIIAALRAEARVFPARQGRLHEGHDYLLRTSGPGAQNAAQAARELLEQRCDVLVSWGVAGALAPELEPGALLITSHARTVDDAPLDCDGIALLSIKALLAQLSPRAGTLLSVSAAAATARVKQDLHARYGAAAVDMESAAIAAVARASGSQFMAIRAIVDDACFDLPDAALVGVDAAGRARVGATVASLLAHPGDIAAMLRLAGHFRSAKATLQRAATQLLA